MFSGHESERPEHLGGAPGPDEIPEAMAFHGQFMTSFFHDNITQ